MRLHSKVLAFAFVVAGALLPNVSQAQVVQALKGGGGQINVYGLYSLVNPDGKSTFDYPQGTHFTNYGNATSWNQAIAMGADFRLGRFAFGQPAIGARLTYSYGPFANESTYMFGPEVHYMWRKLRPYGDFFIGKGNIDYKGTSFKDDSIVYEPGGGVDYHINRRWSIRLIDFQYQFWNLSTHFYPAGFVPGAPAQYVDTTLKPYTISFGVLFRVK